MTSPMTSSNDVLVEDRLQLSLVDTSWVHGQVQLARLLAAVAIVQLEQAMVDIGGYFCGFTACRQDDDKNKLEHLPLEHK